jgi:hypothetical protein
VTGLVNQELLLQNEYLAAENRILRSHLLGRLRLTDPERSILAEIGKRLGRKLPDQVACVANPKPFSPGTEGWLLRSSMGPNIAPIRAVALVSRDIVALVIQMARENPGWGYDRIVGVLSNLGHRVSDQMVGNIPRRYGIAPASKRSANTTWKDFIASHTCSLTGTPSSVPRSKPSWRPEMSNAWLYRTAARI